MSIKNNHIDEYFVSQGMNNNQDKLISKELFKAEKEDVDVKTDLSIHEIVLINKIHFMNDMLLDCKLDGIYTDFLNRYQRLKISLDRKSRGEFVSMNKGETSDEIVDKVSSISNIVSPRK